MLLVLIFTCRAGYTAVNKVAQKLAGCSKGLMQHKENLPASRCFSTRDTGFGAEQPL